MSTPQPPPPPPYLPPGVGVGSRRPRCRRVLVVGLVAAAILVACVPGAVVVNWWRTNEELDRLLTQVEASEATMDEADDDMADLFAELKDSGSEAATRATLDEVQSRAREAAAELEREEDRIRGLSLLPWHGDLDRARDAYVEHNRAWQQFYRELGSSPESWYADGEANMARIRSTWAVATNLFKGLAPVFALHEAEERIEDIFTEEPDATML